MLRVYGPWIFLFACLYVAASIMWVLVCAMRKCEDKQIYLLPLTWPIALPAFACRIGTVLLWLVGVVIDVNRYWANFKMDPNKRRG